MVKCVQGWTSVGSLEHQVVFIEKFAVTDTRAEANDNEEGAKRVRKR